MTLWKEEARRMRKVGSWREVKDMFPEGFMAMVHCKDVDSFDEKERFFFMRPGGVFGECVGDSQEETRLKMAAAGYEAERMPSAYSAGFVTRMADYFFAARRTAGW